jgi:hypothetical protein
VKETGYGDDEQRACLACGSSVRRCADSCRGLDRCDKLMPVIESSDDRKKKVYLFRLKKARDMFEATQKLEE